MKITITPTGDVTLDTDDVDKAISFVNTLRNGATPGLRVPSLIELPEEFQQRKTAWEEAHPTPAVPKKKRGPYKKKAPNGPISPQLEDVLRYLKANDTAGGSTPTQIADILGIAPATISWRLRRLVEKGLVERVGRGHYRASA